MKHIYTFLCLFLLTSYALADIIGKAYVTDGDAIKISGTKIRLDGIDAPEAKQKCERNGQKWQCGQVATQTLRKLIKGQSVTCKGDITDKYRRLIAVCSANSVDLNGAMVDAESCSARTLGLYCFQTIPAGIDIRALSKSDVTM